MLRTLTSSLAALALALVLPGCKDDLGPLQATWATTAEQWQKKIEALNADDVVQTAKLARLCSTPGLDPTNVAAKTCAELTLGAAPEKAQLEALGSAMQRHGAVVGAAIGRGKRMPALAAIEASNTEMINLLARVTDNAQRRRVASKALEEVVTSEVDAAQKAAAAAEARAALWRQAATERTPLELTDIRFVARTAELESPEAGTQRQLEQLVLWANTCPRLTFSITAHESRELTAAQAKALTDGRAAAVKTFLIEHGVAPTKILSATGSGSKVQLADEPAPQSEAATAMNPDELEALRNKNRRITIQAAAVCPVGERAALVRP